MQSISPGARSHRSHRPKLPSIDNDDWEEDNEHRKKSRSHSALSKKHSSKRLSKGQNQSYYGTTNHHERLDTRGRGRKNSVDPHLDITRQIHNKKEISYSSGSESSESDGSCISSDFR